jgi:hypothetical protein
VIIDGESIRERPVIQGSGCRPRPTVRCRSSTWLPEGYDDLDAQTDRLFLYDAGSVAGKVGEHGIVEACADDLSLCHAHALAAIYGVEADEDQAAWERLAQSGTASAASG